MGHLTISDEKFSDGDRFAVGTGANMLRPIYHLIQCGIRANRAAAAALGGILVVVMRFIGWRVWSGRKMLRTHG